MDNRMTGIRQKTGYIWAFLIAFLPRLFWSLQAIPLRTVSDELSTMNGAVFFSSQNWNAVVSKAGYYGFGMSILATPLMQWIKDPVILYRTLLVCTGVLESVAAVICFYLIKRVFGITDEKKALLMTATISYVTVVRTTVFYNEHMLMLISWCICLVLAKLVLTEEPKKRAMWTGFFVLLMLYALTVHARTTTYIFAAVLVIALYGIMYRKKLVSLPVLGILTAGGYILMKKGIKMYQSVVWSAAEGVRNTRVNIGEEKLALLKTAEGIKSCLFTIFGQINIASMISGGLLITALVMVILLIVKKGKEAFVLKTIQADNAEERLYFVIGSFFVLCTGMTIAAQSLTWIATATNAIMDGYGTKEYGTKAFTYLRYMMPYLQPLLMLVFVTMEKQKDVFLNCFYKSIKYIVLFQGIWLAFILPYCYGNKQAGEEFICFALTDRNVATAHTYLPATLVFVVMLLIFFWAGKKEKFHVIMLVLLVTAGYKYCYNAYNWDILTQKENEKKIDTVYQVLGSGELGKEQLTDKLYGLDLSGAEDHQVYYLLQYYFADYKVIPRYPSEDEKEAILFTNRREITNTEVLENYLCIELDSEEYLWVKGEKLQNKILEQVEKNHKKEYHVDLETLYDASSNRNQTDTMSSNGAVGCFATTKGETFSSGEYDFTFTFHVESDENNGEKLATVDIADAITGESYVSGKLQAADVKDGVGKVRFSIPMSNAQNLQIRFFANSSVPVELADIMYKKTSLTDHVGAIYQTETEQLSRIANKIESNADIPMVSEYDSLRWFADYSDMQKAMKANSVFYCEAQKAVEGQQNGKLLLMENRSGGSLIFDLLEQYLVIGKTEHYTLFAKKELRDEIAAQGIRMYSGDKGLSVDYYCLDNDGVIDTAKQIYIPFGTYELTVTGNHCSTGQESVGVLYSSLNRVESPEMIAGDVVKEDGTFEIQKKISIYGLEGLKGNKLMFKMSAQQETGQARLWLKQTSNRNLVPVKGLSVLGDAKQDESGILLGKEAGIKTFGPYISAPAGFYQVTFEFERDGEVQGDLGSVDIAYATEVLVAGSISDSSFDGKKGKVVLEVEITEDDTDPLLEFRTSITGADDSLRLTAVTIEPQ